MSIFTGSGVAIVTPLHADGTINYESFQNLIEFQIANETDAIIVCGTTGEASTLTDEEQLEAIHFTVSQVKKRVPVIAGAGSNYTDHGIQLSIGSQKAGADACLLVTPYYNKCTQKGLVAHYSAIASKIDIPVMLYNVPTRTALNIEPKTAYELSKVENIVAIKEAGGNISQIAQMVELCGDRLDLYSGNDDQIVPLMSLGGKGVVSVLANVCPKDTHDMVMKYLQGDIKGSLALQLKTLKLTNALFIEVNPIPVKAALNLMGMNVGGYRMPLTPMEEAHLDVLRREMADYGLI